MSGVQTIEVGSDEDDMRLDRWFKNHFPELSHGNLQKLMRKGDVRVDGKRVKANARVDAGQMVRVPPISDENPAQRRDDHKRGPKPLTDEDAEWLQDQVLYKDDDIIVINKSAGIPVQGGTGSRRHIDGMLAALCYEYDEKPRLVHRLDKDTSGVLVLARTRAIAKALTESFRSREAKKLYWAIVVGVPRPNQGIVDMKLLKQFEGKGEKVVGDELEGKPSQTIYRVLDQTGQRTAWLAMEPLTGRTHQLRVHCSDALSTPILGDGKYGGTEAFIAGDNMGKGMHLHARAINIPHPKTGKPLYVKAPLPEHMQTTLKFMGMRPEPEYDLFSDEIL